MNRSKSVLVGAALMLGACSGTQSSNMTFVAITGAVVGGFAGGWAGSQLGGGTGETIYTILGVSAGAMAGYDLGRQLTMADIPDYNRAVANAMSVHDGQASWQNSDTGNGGLIRTDQAYLNGTGEECRTYRSTVTFPDEIVSGSGAACHNQSGEWVLVADAFQ